jgi:hypothetical protein
MADPMLDVSCPETQSQTWVPKELLAGLPISTGSAGGVVSDTDLGPLRNAISTRLAVTGSKDDIWYLRQVLGVVDDAIAERSVVVLRPASSDRRDGPVRPGAAENLTSAAIKARFHDAWIDFDSVVSDGTSTRLQGYIERDRRRYRYELTVEPSPGFQLDDQAQTGGTTLGDVHFDGNAIVFVGHIPGRLTVLAPDDTAGIRVEAHPYELRRWFRWRDVPTP